MHTQLLQLDIDEEILFRVRKHWFIFGVEVFSIIVVAILPLFLYVLIGNILIEHNLTTIPYTGYFFALYSGWLIIVWMSLFSIWTNYYLDVWILTTKRFIARDQKGLFNRTTASFRLERLQDVIISINGIIPTFLNFGTLEIQTAGEESNFKAYGLPNLELLKSKILDAAGKLNTSI